MGAIMAPEIQLKEQVAAAAAWAAELVDHCLEEEEEEEEEQEEQEQEESGQ